MIINLDEFVNMDIVFAIIGGMVGGGVATSRVKDGIVLSTITIIIGGIGAAGVVEYVEITHKVWTCMLVGFLIGTLLPKIIATLEAFVPNLIRSLAEKFLGIDIGEGKALSKDNEQEVGGGNTDE